MQQIRDHREVYVAGVVGECEATRKGNRIQYFFFLGDYAFLNEKYIQRLNEHRSLIHEGAPSVPHLPRGRRPTDGIPKPSRYNPKNNWLKGKI